MDLNSLAGFRSVSEIRVRMPAKIQNGVDWIWNEQALIEMSNWLVDSEFDMISKVGSGSGMISTAVGSGMISKVDPE